MKPTPVRPIFRRALTLTLIFLALDLAWSAWDLVEARRLAAALERARVQGLLPASEPSAQSGSVSIPESVNDAARFFQAAADLVPNRPEMAALWRALRNTER